MDFFSSKCAVIVAVMSLICFASEVSVGPESVILKSGCVVVWKVQQEEAKKTQNRCGTIIWAFDNRS